MHEVFHMSIKEIFFLRDGRTVFAGPIEEGELAIIEPGPAVVQINGKTLATVQIEREAIASRAQPLERLEVRAVSTRDPTGLNKETVATQDCTLEGTMRYSGHRHLVGIDSPPPDFVPDDMTLGPRLPDGWDGDAWMKPGGSSYFLRAWNKAHARCATAQDAKYEDARTRLLAAIAAGGRKVEISATELAT
jgi:hypothetical protein